jgi:hypothetical protein
MTSGGLTQQDKFQSQRIMDQGVLDLGMNDPLMASASFSPFRLKEHPKQENAKRAEQEKPASRDGLPAEDHGHKPNPPVNKPDSHHLPEVHIHHPANHHKPNLHHNVPIGNENQEPADGEKDEPEPGSIMGGAGAPPPGGDGQHLPANWDPDYCSVENWFKNTVTVINPEGKDPQVAQGDKQGDDGKEQREKKSYTPEEIEKIISQFEYEHERETARYLLENGEDVQKNPNEGQPGEGDAIVNGENTEFKAVYGVSNETSDGISRAFASRVMDARSQALNVIVNVWHQLGMTKEIAERGVSRAYGAADEAGAKIQSIRVLGNGFDFVKRQNER